MFRKVLVANRGVVAARVLRALRSLAIPSVAVYSDADRQSPYLALADETYAIGPPPPQASYLDQDRLMHVLASSGADALHPGYGFLSENATFARRVGEQGATFVGPAARWIAEMGEKTSARDLMARHGMPVGAGSSLLPEDSVGAVACARLIGYPVLVKPAEGGGGVGMLVAQNDSELLAAVDRAKSMAQRSFGSGKIYLEAYLACPRHIEFQVLADNHGSAMHLFERDCSIQRRHQKVLEEAPAPGLAQAETDAMADRVVAVLTQLGYNNIGTVETLHVEDGSFNFLEMNTRLQVEHAVTEEITGVDLVKSQIRLAAGEKLGNVVRGTVSRRGHAIQARVYAEDPCTFYPSPGVLRTFRPPHGAGIRVEVGYKEGNEVTPYYDPLLAKIIVCAKTRNEAIHRLVAALGDFVIEGVKTNIPFLQRVLESDAFRAGAVHTGLARSLATAKPLA